MLLRQPCDRAPVSALYSLGRGQDLAFEKPIGDDADSRHHVRFWQVIPGVRFGAAARLLPAGP